MRHIKKCIYSQQKYSCWNNNLIIVLKHYLLPYIDISKALLIHCAYLFFKPDMLKPASVFMDDLPFLCYGLYNRISRFPALLLDQYNDQSMLYPSGLQRRTNDPHVLIDFVGFWHLLCMINFITRRRNQIMWRLNS